MTAPESRIELTLRLWRAGTRRQLEAYIDRLLELLPRHGGRFERRAAEVDAGPARPYAVLVLSFPDGASVDSYLHDPFRNDLDDLGAQAVARSLITDARTHSRPEQEPSPAARLPPVAPPSPDAPAPGLGSA